MTSSARRVCNPKPCSAAWDISEIRRRHQEEQAQLRYEMYHRNFVVGKKYFIGDKGNYKPDDQTSLVFVYLGQKGKHYMFMHINGGWLTTRTVAQLVGKKIEEVE